MSTGYLKLFYPGPKQQEEKLKPFICVNISTGPVLAVKDAGKIRYVPALNDGMNLLYPKILESRGMVPVSPVHNYNITAWMKEFIDRLYCFYDFNNERPRTWSGRLAGQERKAVIGAVAEQEDKRDMGFTLEAMRMPLEALGFEILEEIAVLGLV